MPRPGLEAAKDDLAEDGDAVAPVEGNGADVEDAQDSRVAAQADEVNGNTPEDGDPDCIERGTGAPVDLGPDVAKGEEAVARKGKDGAPKSLRGCEADELQDDEGADGEGDATCFAEDIVEDLRNGLAEWGGEDAVDRIVDVVAHAEAEDYVEEKAGKVGEDHGH